MPWSWEAAPPLNLPNMALSLPGTSGNYASTPDSAANSIVGDIDIRVEVALDSWLTASVQMLVAKFLGAGVRSYMMNIDTSGNIRFQWSVDGTATVTKASTVPTGLAAGAVKWLRATLDVDNGATGNDTKFYMSDDGVAWTQLGATVTTAGVTSIFDSTAILEIGSRSTGTVEPLAGKVHYAEVRSGIDGPIVARFDPSAVARTAARLPATLTQPGGTPNIITPQQASLEDGTTTGWTASTNATIANSAAQALDGTKSLAITATAIGASQAYIAGIVGQVVGNKLYTLKANFRAATVGRATYVLIQWFNAAGGFISNSASGNSTDVTTGWTEASLIALAPPTAARGDLIVRINDAAQLATEVHHVDRISFVETPTVWTVNGAAWDWVDT